MKYKILVGKCKNEVLDLMGLGFNYYPADFWFYILKRNWFGGIRILFLYFEGDVVSSIRIHTCYGKVPSRFTNKR